MEKWLWCVLFLQFEVLREMIDAVVGLLVALPVVGCLVKMIVRGGLMRMGHSSLNLLC